MTTKTKKADKRAVLSSVTSRQVSNGDLFKASFRAASDAAIGVTAVFTREPYRVQAILHEVAGAINVDFKSWTLRTGWQSFHKLTDETEQQADVDYTAPIEGEHDSMFDPGQAMDKLAEEWKEQDGIYMMMSVSHALDNPGVQQRIRHLSWIALETDIRVVLVLPEGATIPPEIQDDIHILDFLTPSHKELYDTWVELSKNIEEGYYPSFDEDGINRIIENASGMSDSEFEQALAMALVELKDKLGPDAEEPATEQDFIDFILKSKISVIKKTDLLEFQPPGSMNEIGGLDIYKTWLTKRGEAFTPEAREYGIDMPRGCMIIGPPGTGKSLVAKATANVLGVPCIKFDIGKVFNMYVGNSESRVRSALKMIESMAPCVLLMDEIDKGFSGAEGGGDGGTSARVFGTFLTWMQDRQSDDQPIFVVMTANRVMGLPPELMRKGRLDEIWAVTFPSDAERKEILSIHFEKRGHPPTIALLDQIAKATDGFVGAELEAIVKQGLLECFIEDDGELNPARFVTEAEQIIPLSRAFAERVKAMNKWAEDNAKRASSGGSIDPPKPAKTKRKRTIRAGGKRRPSSGRS